ncbi:MAG TPA: PASTA domain-containing protein [Candidatus Babeliales bacterium]|nr:PASTA domain-containing protein [Candidatus Babeliales bacterium]
MKLTYLLSLIPFLCFIFGYKLLAYLYHVETIKTPCLVGMQLQHAFPLLSAHNLNPRLVAYKESAELPTGTILSQTPEPDITIKPNQAMYLVVSQQPPKITTPNLLQKSDPAIARILKADTIHHKPYILNHTSPTGHCFGQFPAPGTPLEEKKIITYMASETNKSILLPNFKGKSIPQVIEFLKNHSISYTITHHSPQAPGHTCSDTCMVHDQRPLAYSIIPRVEQKSLHLQLQVRS